MTLQSNRGEEKIEGLGDEKTDSWGGYPIDSLLIRHTQRTIYEVMRRIDQDNYIMDPDFQRDFIWPEDMQSRLIESVMMRLPLPVFYLAENSEGKMIVVDGLQRLNTFHRFKQNQLKLKLPNRPQLNGKTFDELTPQLQNRFEDCNLIIYSIDSEVGDQTKLDIFERVNSGIPLSKQQMRNCLYMGESTQFLKDESQASLFLEATGNSLRTDNMRDREFINRFCSFQILDVNEYKTMDDFLARSLEEMNEKASLEELSTQLKYALKNNLYLFKEHAFRRHERYQEGRNVLNASLWDVMSTGLSRYYPQHIVEESDNIQDGFYSLMKEEAFVDSITKSPNTPKQVRLRFQLSRKMFEEVLGAYQN